MKNLFAAAALTILLGACASTPFADRTSTAVDGDVLDARSAIDSMTSPPEPYRSVDQPFVLAPPVTLTPTIQEPTVLDSEFAYGQDAASSLSDAAFVLGQMSGLKMRVAADAYDQAAARAPNGVAIARTAPLRHLLDELTAMTGTAWRWTGSEVLIYYRDVRAFRLEVVPPSIEDAGTITNASSSGGQGGGQSGGQGGGQGESGQGGVQTGLSGSSSNEQTTTVSYTFDIYKDTVDAVKQMLADGSTVSGSSSTGSIIVRGTATELDAVGRYVEQVNAQLKRQVVIELTVLTIDQKDEDALGIDWSILNSSSRASVAALGPAGTGINGASIDATIVNPASPFDGSRLIIDALRTKTNASVKRRNIITALDNQPMRVQSIVESPYPSGVQTVLIPNAGATTTEVTALQTTGFSLTLTPLVVDQSTILLQAQGSLSVPLERIVCKRLPVTPTSARSG